MSVAQAQVCTLGCSQRCVNFIRSSVGLDIASFKNLQKNNLKFALAQYECDLSNNHTIILVAIITTMIINSNNNNNDNNNLFKKYVFNNARHWYAQTAEEVIENERVKAP